MPDATPSVGEARIEHEPVNPERLREQLELSRAVFDEQLRMQRAAARLQLNQILALATAGKGVDMLLAVDDGNPAALVEVVTMTLEALARIERSSEVAEPAEARSEEEADHG